MTNESWYVVVFTMKGPVFVTGCDYRHNTCEWDRLKSPMQFDDKMTAMEVARGLSFNVGPAYAICTQVGPASQLVDYSKGHFEFVLDRKEVR